MLGAAFLSAGLATCLFMGCASAPKQDLSFVTQALKATDVTKTKLSDASEADVVSRFKKFNGEKIQNKKILVNTARHQVAIIN